MPKSNWPKISPNPSATLQQRSPRWNAVAFFEPSILDGEIPVSNRSEAMVKRWLAAVFLFSVFLQSGRCADSNAGHWIVVTAPAFQAAITPLIEKRKSQGFRVSVLQTSDWLSSLEIQTRKPRKLRDRIRSLLKEHA